MLMPLIAPEIQYRSALYQRSESCLAQRLEAEKIASLCQKCNNMPSNNFKAVYTVHMLMIIRSASHQSDVLGQDIWRIFTELWKLNPQPPHFTHTNLDIYSQCIYWTCVKHGTRTVISDSLDWKHLMMMMMMTWWCGVDTASSVSLSVWHLLTKKMAAGLGGIWVVLGSVFDNGNSKELSVRRQSL